MERIPLWRRYARFFGPDPKADVRDELQFHLEAKVEDLIGQGWEAGAARREAERQFGDLQAVQRAGERFSQERHRAERRHDYWGEFSQDLRYTLRALSKDRSYAVIAVIILALGIAANTAVFSVVNTVLLRPLPFFQADRLTWLASGRHLNATLRETAGLSGVTYTVAAYEEFQRPQPIFPIHHQLQPFFRQQ